MKAQLFELCIEMRRIPHATYGLANIVKRVYGVQEGPYIRTFTAFE